MQMPGSGQLTLTTTVVSPIGPLTLTSRSGRLTGLYMQDAAHVPAPGSEWVTAPGEFADVTAQLDAYFAGELTDFDVSVDLGGSDFQRQVWTGLRAIPYGGTCSYAQLAAAVGRPRACRAVGLANGRNPVAIIVPCHRVVASGGGLGGYAGGLDRKSWLLAHERAGAARRQD